MNTWYIYVERGVDVETKIEYRSRRYYRKELKPCPSNLLYVGQAELSDEYFILGCETQHTDIVDLNDVELHYKAALKDGQVVSFRHTFGDLLVKAKEGIMPYLSFSGFRVVGVPKLIIKGKLHSTKNPLHLEPGD